MTGGLKRGRIGQAFCATAVRCPYVWPAAGCLTAVAPGRPPSSLYAAASATADTAAVRRTRATRHGRPLLARACRCRRRDEAGGRGPPTSGDAVRGGESTGGTDIGGLHRLSADGEHVLSGELSCRHQPGFSSPTWRAAWHAAFPIRRSPATLLLYQGQDSACGTHYRVEIRSTGIICDSPESAAGHDRPY